jgi:hypothetical protein
MCKVSYAFLTRSAIQCTIHSLGQTLSIWKKPDRQQAMMMRITFCVCARQKYTGTMIVEYFFPAGYVPIGNKL